MRSLSIAALMAVTLPLSGCNYGFQAGSLFADVETLAVVPFENDTDMLELTQQLHEVLLRELPSNLGVRQAGAEVADAVVQGNITRYDVTAPSYRSSGTGQAQVLQREVLISISVRIVDRRENLVLWEGNSLQAQGRFLEASETEDSGRRLAIEQLAQNIIDGAQSTW